MLRPGDRIRLIDTRAFHQMNAASHGEPYPRPLHKGEKGTIIKHPNGELDIELDDPAVGLIGYLSDAIQHIT